MVNTLLNTSTEIKGKGVKQPERLKQDKTLVFTRITQEMRKPETSENTQTYDS